MLEIRPSRVPLQASLEMQLHLHVCVQSRCSEQQALDVFPCLYECWHDLLQLITPVALLTNRNCRKNHPLACYQLCECAVMCSPFVLS